MGKNADTEAGNAIVPYRERDGENPETDRKSKVNRENLAIDTEPGSGGSSPRGKAKGVKESDSTFLTAVPDAADERKVKTKKKNAEPQEDKALEEMFPGLERTAEGQAIKNAKVGKESQMPKKAHLRKAQNKLLQKISKTVSHYRQEFQAQLERILCTTELEYQDEEGRAREKLKPSISHMMKQLH